MKTKLLLIGAIFLLPFLLFAEEDNSDTAKFRKRRLQVRINLVIRLKSLNGNQVPHCI